MKLRTMDKLQLFAKTNKKDHNISIQNKMRKQKTDNMNKLKINKAQIK